MKTYYDTGILLKLYTAEPGSPAVQAFIHERREAIRISDLHHAECVSALRLKLFRGECTPAQSRKALASIAGDLRTGTLRLVAVEWGAAWNLCRESSETHAAETGVRTLDALHVACAIVLKAREFVSSDKRQLALAGKAGMEVFDPTTC